MANENEYFSIAPVYMQPCVLRWSRLTWDSNRSFLSSPIQHPDLHPTAADLKLFCDSLTENVVHSKNPFPHVIHNAVFIECRRGCQKTCWYPFLSWSEVGVFFLRTRNVSIFFWACISELCASLKRRGSEEGVWGGEYEAYWDAYSKYASFTPKACF